MADLKVLSAKAATDVQVKMLVEDGPKDLTAMKEGKATYDAIKHELTANLKEAKGKFWRLVYNADTKVAMHLFEADGRTRTIWDMVTGTRDECLKFIEDQKLDDSELNDLEQDVPRRREALEVHK